MSVDVPERPGRVKSRSVHIGVTTVRGTQMSRFLILNQRVQIRQIVLKTDFFERSAKTWTALPDNRVAT